MHTTVFFYLFIYFLKPRLHPEITLLAPKVFPPLPATSENDRQSAVGHPIVKDRCKQVN